MNTIDNSLHAEIILLATKALDLLNKALDLLSADVVGRSAFLRPCGSKRLLSSPSGRLARPRTPPSVAAQWVTLPSVTV